MVYQVAFSVLLVPLWIESTCFCFCIDMNLVVLAQQYLLFDLSLMLSCFSVLSYVDFGYFREYVQEITWWKCSNCGSWEEENGKGKGKYVYYKRIGVRKFLSQSSISVTPLRSCRRMLHTPEAASAFWCSMQYTQRCNVRRLRLVGCASSTKMVARGLQAKELFVILTSGWVCGKHSWNKMQGGFKPL